METKSTKNIAVGMVKIGCGHSGVGVRAKIGCISKRNQWNKLALVVLIKSHVEDYGHFKTERAFMILK